MTLAVHPVTPDDRPWMREFVLQVWGVDLVIGHSQAYVPSELPGFIARRADAAVGLLTYTIDGEDCEIVTINSRLEGRGVGTALLEAVAQEARRRGCRRLWLITTNDNLHALGFYQRRGFRIIRVVPDAVERARRRKPEIPLVAENGIPIRDELMLEKWL